MVRALLAGSCLCVLPALARAQERLLQPVAGDAPIAMGTTKGERFSRLVIRNATIISGRGTPGTNRAMPPEGPVDIVIEGNTIVNMIPVDPVNSAGYGRYLHGEAISLGQVGAAVLSQAVLGMPSADAVRISNLLAAAGLPTHIRLTPKLRQSLVAAMKLDKKVSGGKVKFVLAEKIGAVRWGQSVPEQSLLNALDALARPTPKLKKK